MPMNNDLFKCFVLAFVPFGAMAYPAPEPDPSLPPSAVEPTVQQIRRQMLDPGLNSLTFHNMDEIFTTRSVPRSGDVWALARNDQDLDFSYTFEGETYTPDEFLERTYTNALLIIKNDRIVYEKYRNNTDASTRFMGWSMTKSWTALLVGIALEEGLIDSIDDTVEKYLPELDQGGYAGVTLRQILQMRSGVDYEERYDFANPGIAAKNHENALVKNIVRFADVARTIGRKHEPGTVWAYKTIDTAVLGWLIERVSGNTVAGYTALKVWEPLGAEADGFYILDGPPGVGREFSGAGLSATGRDFARLGRMLLNGGVANGKRVISKAWLDEATAPTEAAGGTGNSVLGSGYGYQFWMGLRPGSYEASGLQGQYVHVDPKSQTIIVKLSYFPPGDMAPHLETQEFFSATSAWNPDK